MVAAIREADENKQAEMGFLRRNAKRLRESWFVVGLEAAGLIGLLAAVGLFVYELRERQDERVARSWQTLTTPASGNSGKSAALSYLNSKYGCFPTWSQLDWCWKRRTPMRGIDLSKGKKHAGVYLISSDLQEADFSNANLSNVILEHAKLTDANLQHANLDGAKLDFADLSGATFFFAKLRNAWLTNAIFDRATLRNADLSGAYLHGASLQGTFLENANLKNASLTNANLRGARLSMANVNGVSFEGANLEGANLSDVDFKGANFGSKLSCGELNRLAGWCTVNLEYAEISGSDFSDITFTRENESIPFVKLEGIWAYIDKPPSNIPPEVERIISYRNQYESWDDFLERTKSENVTVD